MKNYLLIGIVLISTLLIGLYYTDNFDTYNKVQTIENNNSTTFNDSRVTNIDLKSTQQESINTPDFSIKHDSKDFINNIENPNIEQLSIEKVSTDAPLEPSPIDAIHSIENLAIKQAILNHQKLLFPEVYPESSVIADPENLKELKKAIELHATAEEEERLGMYSPSEVPKSIIDATKYHSRILNDDYQEALSAEEHTAMLDAIRQHKDYLKNSDPYLQTYEEELTNSEHDEKTLKAINDHRNSLTQ